MTNGFFFYFLFLQRCTYVLQVGSTAGKCFGLIYASDYKYFIKYRKFKAMAVFFQVHLAFSSNHDEINRKR